MSLTRVKGGWSLVDVSNNENFTDQGYTSDGQWNVTLTHILKGTKVDPGTPQDDYDNGLAGATGKSAKILIRSANFDSDIFTKIKAAELAHTKLFFRFINGPIALLVNDVVEWIEYQSSYINLLGDAYLVDTGCPTNEKLLTKAIGPFDLRLYKYLRVKWLMQSVVVYPSILLDDTPQCNSPLEILNLESPGNNWNVFNELRALSNPANLQSIFSVGLRNGIGSDYEIMPYEIWGVQNAIVLKNILPTVETEVNEFGKFNALRIQGVGAADTEANLMELKI
jgi:hypothetical protein